MGSFPLWWEEPLHLVGDMKEEYGVKKKGEEEAEKGEREEFCENRKMIRMKREKSLR